MNSPTPYTTAAPVYQPALEPCRTCKKPGQIVREISFQLEGVRVQIQAHLCGECLVKVPAMLREAIDKPMVRAVLKVVGINLGLFKGD